MDDCGGWLAVPAVLLLFFPLEALRYTPCPFWCTPGQGVLINDPLETDSPCARRRKAVQAAKLRVREAWLVRDRGPRKMPEGQIDKDINS